MHGIITDDRIEEPLHLTLGERLRKTGGNPRGLDADRRIRLAQTLL